MAFPRKYSDDWNDMVLRAIELLASKKMEDPADCYYAYCDESNEEDYIDFCENCIGERIRDLEEETGNEWRRILHEPAEVDGPISCDNCHEPLYYSSLSDWGIQEEIFYGLEEWRSISWNYPIELFHLYNIIVGAWDDVRARLAKILYEIIWEDFDESKLLPEGVKV